MQSKQHPRRSQESAGRLHLSYILRVMSLEQSDSLPLLPVTANLDSVEGHSVMRMWTCRSALQILKWYILCLVNELLDLVHISLDADKRKIRRCHQPCEWARKIRHGSSRKQLDTNP